MQLSIHLSGRSKNNLGKKYLMCRIQSIGIVQNTVFFSIWLFDPIFITLQFDFFFTSKQTNRPFMISSNETIWK